MKTDTTTKPPKALDSEWVGDCSATSCSALPFSKLWVGDRFEQGDGIVWTKISRDTARRHGLESVALRERGYGYIGDALCSFEEIDPVFFLPPNSQDQEL